MLLIVSNQPAPASAASGFCFGEMTMGCVPCNQKWSLPEKAVKGAVGLVKVAAGVDAVSETVLRNRLQSCAVCPSLRRIIRGVPDGVLPGIGDSCSVCGCLVHGKARLASERCPDGRWADG